LNFANHVRFAGAALKAWLRAQLQDSLAVGVLWWIGLHFIKVPLAPLWAALAAVLQVIPHIGPAVGLIGPVLAASLTWRDWRHPLWVFALYAGIALVDGFLLQPYIMERTARVPMWASILAPVVLGYLIPFWGVLLAPPLLAVGFAYRARKGARTPPPEPPLSR
jgi:predicted PurR-regulated permease PerM